MNEKPHLKESELLDLLQRIKKQDQQAVTVLYERCQNILWFWAMNIVDDSEVAKDIVQEFFVHLWENSNVDIQQPWSYMKTAIENRSKNYVRNAGVRKGVERNGVIEATDENMFLRKAHGDQVMQELHTGLNTLTRKKSVTVFRQVFINELTHAQAAKANNISVLTVNNHIMFCKEALRKYFENNPESIIKNLFRCRKENEK